MTFTKSNKSLYRPQFNSLIFIMGVLTIVASYLQIGISNRVSLKNRSVMSLADCFVYQRTPFFFLLFIVPTFLLHVTVTLKNDFLICSVIRQSSRISLWKSQVVKMIKLSFVDAVFYLVITLGTGMFFSNKLINWNQWDSVYFTATQSLSEVKFIVVLIAFFLSSLLTMLIAGIVFLLFWWKTNKIVAGWLIVVLLSAWDIMPHLFPLIFNRISIQYQDWQSGNIVGNLIFGLLLCILIPILGSQLSKGKDFLLYGQI